MKTKSDPVLNCKTFLVYSIDATWDGTRSEGFRFVQHKGWKKSVPGDKKSWEALKKVEVEEVGEGHLQQSRCGYFPRGMQDGKSLTEIMSVVVVVLDVFEKKIEEVLFAFNMFD